MTKLTVCKKQQLFTATTAVVDIKVADVKSWVEHELFGTDEVERLAGDAHNVACAVVGVSV